MAGTSHGLAALALRTFTNHQSAATAAHTLPWYMARHGTINKLFAASVFKVQEYKTNLN
jgi:hypothetical protein